MAEKRGSRFKRAWNAFLNRDPTYEYVYTDLGMGYSYRPDRVRYNRGYENTIVTSIKNRIALDVASIPIEHVVLDNDGRYKETKRSGLNECLNIEANIDQTGRSFIFDAVYSMLDEGYVALVPIETDIDPKDTNSFDILNFRVGKIINWYPQHVKVNVYNEITGKKEDLILEKRCIGIIENPFYSVMNEQNSTLKRLTRKLSLLDAIDEQSSSGKLDLIIQLPYTIKHDAKRQQAENRRKDIEMQLTGSKYGIAYTDATEKITQLNRPIENNLMKQVEYLTSMAFSQLGMTQSILDGTANEETMINYISRIVKVILKAFVDEIKRKFLTKTARSQGQSIMFFVDPFERVTAANMADASDKYTRNEILSKNEVRHIIGRKPSSDPKADQLINSNISQPNGSGIQNKPVVNPEVPEETIKKTEN